MVLHAVEPARFVADGDVRAGVGVRDEREALGDLFHVVAVTHPRHALFGKTLEELAARVKKRLGLAVFARGGVVCGDDLAAEVVRDELAAVADAEHGHARVKERGIDVRRVLEIHAGEDEADGLHREKVRKRGRIGLDLAVNAAFAHAARDELVVLAAKVQYDDGLMVHIEILLPYPIIW